MKTTLELKDFLDYRFPSRLTPSPDRGKVAFIVSQSDYENNTYRADVHVFDRTTRETKQVTRRGDVSSVAWVDGETLLVGVRDHGHPVPQGQALSAYHTFRLDGTDAGERFTIPMQVFSLQRVDSHRYAVLANYHMNCPDGAALAEEAERQKSYLVYDELPFHWNGRGYINKTRQRLYLYDADDASLTPISDGDADIEFYSVCGDKVAYVGKHYGSQNRRTFLNGLDIFDVEKRKSRQILPDDQLRIRYAGYLDGELVYSASDGKRYGYPEENPVFFRYDEAAGRGEVFAENEYSASNSVGSDCHLGIHERMQAADGGIYYQSTRGGDAHLFHAAFTGELRQVTTEPGTVDEFVAFEDEILMIAMRGDHIDELYSLKEGKEEKLTSFNDWVVDERTLSTPERISFENDGVALEGYVMRPVGYEPGKKYPGVLTIHGGHKCAYGSVFYHEMQCWANRGFFVIYCNPRGSDGGDNDFAHIVGRFGDVDYADLMRFTDECIRRYPDLDGDRLGVAGGSYGGFMTNWVIGHTDRFKCAVSQRSISNWIFHFGAADTGYQGMFYDTSGVNEFWTDLAAYWNQSPLKYAHNCVTPTLFIHADQDYRCPLSGAEEMFTVLQYNGIESRMCVFKGENHELSRSGKPVNRLNRLREIMAWLEGHLQ